MSKLSMGSTPRRVVVIAGPTAVGKSALAMQLCDKLPGELISVDSVQVYRGLQIGANKPSEAELARVVHHLVNIREPDQEYTAGRFFADALHAIDDVLSRGRVPVLCGGTSMYLRWLVGGRPDAPKADPEVTERVRQRLAPLEASGDWTAGLEQLAALDPARAEKLSRNDWYRLQRALCVALQTGTAASALAPQLDSLDELRASLDMRCFFLSAPREPLCRRIDARCETMLASGLLEETSELLRARRLLPSSPAGRAIGYRQVLQYLMRDPWKQEDAATLREFVEGFAAASRRYAAQQTKWFRGEPSFEWLEVDWARPELAEAHVLSRVAAERVDFERGLVSAEQASSRAVKPEEGKAMKFYVPQFTSLADAASRARLLSRADTCNELLAPHLSEILAADAELAKRYPWHSGPQGGKAATPGIASDEGSASDEPHVAEGHAKRARSAE